jgi:Ca2+-binding RTX toxin-like protein
MIQFSVQAYVDGEPGVVRLADRHLPSHWQYVSPLELGMTLISSDQNGNSTYRFQGQDITVDAAGYFIAGPASTNAAYVAVDLTNHRLAIVFRGTDSLASPVTSDLVYSYPGILTDDLSGRVAGFLAAISAAKSYFIQLHSGNSAFELVTTGHSLGGALAEALVRIDPDFNTGYGFAAPSTTINSVGGNSFVDITHDTDWVGTLYSADHDLKFTDLLSGPRDSGHQVVLVDNTYGPSIGGNSHKSSNYASEIIRLGTSDAFKDVSATDLRFIYIANKGMAFDGVVPVSQFAFLGSDNNDRIDGIERSDFLRIEGSFGNDWIRGGSAGDVLSGGFGTDTIQGKDGDDTVYGGYGSDTIQGGNGGDTIYGGEGNDFLEGGSGADTVTGGSGSDRYIYSIGEGHDTFDDNGDGYDTIALFTGQLFANFDYNWFSRSGNDLLIRAPDGSGGFAIDITIRNMGSSTGAIERIEIWAGNGTVQANAWNLSALWAGLTQPPPLLQPPPQNPEPPSGDTITLTAANDTVNGGTSSHVFVTLGEGQDTISAGGVSDQLFIDYRWTSQAVSASFWNSAYQVQASSNALAATGIEAITILGGTGNDNLSGGAGGDYLDGGAGDDNLSGGDGDALIGGDGNDFLTTTLGINWIDGGSGIDTWQGNFSASSEPLQFLSANAASASGFVLANGTIVRNVENVEVAFGSGGDTAFTDGHGQDVFVDQAVGVVVDRLVVDDSWATQAVTTSGDNSFYVYVAVGDGSVDRTAAYRFEAYTISGGLGADDLRGYGYDDTFYGNGGDDYLVGFGGNDTLDGGDGNDQLNGGEGNDTLLGGAGNDLLDGGRGVAWIDGGSGIDTAALNLSDQTQSITYETTAAASATGYTLIDGSHVQNIEDTVLSTGTGADLIFTDGHGQDVFVDQAVGVVVDRLVVDDSWATQAVTTSGDNSFYVYVAVGDGSVDRTAAYRFEAYTISGGLGADDLRGYGYDDTFYGNGGDDYLVGFGGNDTLDGGDGNDTLDGGEGTNILNGAAGNDRLLVSAAGSGSNVNGGANVDTLAVSGTVSLGIVAGMEAIELGGGAALTLTGAQVSSGFALNTAITGSGSLTINMTAGLLLPTKLWSVQSGIAVTINGTSGVDVMKLGNVVQTVNGGDGQDQIKGGSQVDTINGGGGIDKIMGLGGADILTGGAGNDVFRYLAQGDSGLGVAADRITDLTIGQDRINFKDIDADAVTTGDQAFAFLGTAAFGATGTGQIRFQNSGADLLVQLDVNGDGAADMEVVLQGLAGQVLTGADFVL